MAAQQPRFSPKQIAEALEVSESSVKRWCDKGSIPTVRTLGGHRRITLDALQRFIQQSGRELRLPHVLGMPQLSPARPIDVPGDDAPAQTEFRQRLAEGDEEGCRRLLRQRIEQCGCRGTAVEDLITDAMHGFGTAWQQHQVDVYQERRGCEICMRLLSELRRELPALDDDAPYAFGGTPEGDPYHLPTTMVELALREAGWDAVSLGNNLPLESFLQAAHDRPPQLVWLSVSTTNNVAAFIAQQNQLAETLGEQIPLLVGGRALTDELRPKLRYTAHCDSIRQMIDLAAMMHWGGR